MNFEQETGYKNFKWKKKKKYLYEQLSNLAIWIIQQQILETDVSLQDITGASELHFLKLFITWETRLLPHHK